MKIQIVKKISLLFAPLMIGAIYMSINGCNGNVEISANECQIQLGLCLADAQSQWETGDQVDIDPPDENDQEVPGSPGEEDPSQDTLGVYRANLRTCWDHYNDCIEPGDVDDLLRSDEFTSKELVTCPCWGITPDGSLLDNFDLDLEITATDDISCSGGDMLVQAITTSLQPNVVFQVREDQGPAFCCAAIFEGPGTRCLSGDPGRRDLSPDEVSGCRELLADVIGCDP